MGPFNLWGHLQLGKMLTLLTKMGGVVNPILSIADQVGKVNQLIAHNG